HRDQGDLVLLAERRQRGDPATLRAKRSTGPSRPTRASSVVALTSTPQIRFVTVTCLVHAIDNRATVRSCVTLRQAVPRLTRGCCLRWDGRRAPRTGSGGHRTPCSVALTRIRQIGRAHV